MGNPVTIASERWFVPGIIAVGVALILWHHDWDTSWFVTAYGVGLGVLRWVSWKYVIAVAGVLFAAWPAVVIVTSNPWAPDLVGATATGLLLGAIGARRVELAVRW